MEIMLKDKNNIISLVINTCSLQIRHSIFEDELILKDLWQDTKVRQFLGGVVSDEIIVEK
jgi:hypothetical protein